MIGTPVRIRLAANGVSAGFSPAPFAAHRRSPMLPSVSFAVLALELLLALVATVALTVVGLARFLLRPPRMTDGKAMALLGRMDPGDLGLPYEPCHFDVPDARGKTLRLAAWWIEAAGSDRTCVLVHGYGDAKVGALAWAPAWRAAGFNLLLIDLRAHGESGGTDSTGGFFERDDLDAVLNQLRAQRPEATRLVALFGVSLGGAVVLATAARRDDLAGVVVDSVFDDYRRAVATHAGQMRAPLQSLLPWVIALAERWSGARFGEACPVDTLAAVRCPVLLIHGEADLLLPDGAIDRLKDALRRRANPRDAHWRLPDTGHVLALAAAPEEYARRVADFAAQIDADVAARVDA